MQIALNPQLVSRALAFALLALLIVTIWTAGVQPVISGISEASEKLDEQRTLLGRLRGVAASRDEADRLEQETRSLGEGARLVQGRTEAIKVASLQSMLTALTSREGAQLRTTRALQAKERDGIRMIGVQIQLVGDIEQLQSILLNVEGSATPLFVDALQATALPPRGESTRRGILDVRLDVFTPVLQSAE